MPSRDLVVDAGGVSKWFGGATALDRVDLQIGPGCVHGLLGPNGAGKSTLLSVLLGLVHPDEGVTLLFGRTRAEGGPDWLNGVGGFVETPRFYPYLSARANLRYLAGLDGPGSVDLIEDALRLVDLDPTATAKVRGYSLGMRQRLGLAAALIRRPRLLILDEPGNGMDPAGLRDLRATLRRLAGEGLAVLLSSHDMNQVAEVCDRVTVLNRGRVAFAGSLDQMRAAAPRPVFRLATSDDPAALIEASRVADLQVAGGTADGLRVVADQHQLDQYVIRLGGAGIAVRALVEEASPLESFFFQLTEDPASVEGPRPDEVRPPFHRGAA